MHRLIVMAGGLVCVSVAVVFGCGTESSSFPEGTSSGGVDAGGNGFGFDLDGSASDGGSSGQLGDTGAACKTEESAAALQPIYLGFAFDVSGSMGQLDCPYWNHDPTLKWTPVVEATVAFFQDPASTNINASLTLFPSKDDKCVVGSYTTPVVPMTGLPSPLFRTALKAYETEANLPGGYTDPMPIGGASWRGSTPTRFAVEGVASSLRPLKVQHPDAKIALVVVTDGLPGGCDGSQMPHVTAAVEAARADGIPTYVIGVRDPAAPAPGAQPLWEQDGGRTWACSNGNGSFAADYSNRSQPRPTEPAALDNLSTIADAGATGSAVLLDTGNPAATKAAFTAAINAIRANQISCELRRPAPPAGQTFDAAKVNVRYDSTGASTSLGFDPECKATNAWRYKGAGTDVIELCPSTCTTVRADPAASLKVEFGCVRRSATVN